MTHKIKIFLDGADRSSILEMAPNPSIHGFTTNPTLMRKSGVKDYPGFCKEIVTQLNGKPISFEVFADDLPGMKRQASEIASWGSNIYVKIPVTNTQGVPTAPLVRDLAQNGVKLNVTAVFTVKQCLEVALALQGGAPSILSVFAGRIADTGRNPMPILSAAAEIVAETDRNIELLWASTREAYNIVQAQESGCHIITAPMDMIKKSAMFGSDLYELSLATIRMFKTDADSAGFSLDS